MWKIKVKFVGKSNYKKHDMAFSLFPCIGYTSRLYNHRSSHSIHFMLFFFDLEIQFNYES